MMYMVRKQLYLTEQLNAELKQRSAEAGVSEAEFVRRALTTALKGQSTVVDLRYGRHEAMDWIERFWAANETALESDFQRDELYAERLRHVSGRRN